MILAFIGSVVFVVGVALLALSGGKAGGHITTCGATLLVVSMFR